MAQWWRICLPMQKTWVQSRDWEDPLEEGMTTHSNILAWRIPMDRGVLWATVHGVTKSPTWLSDWTELNWIPFFAFYCYLYWASLVAQMVKNLPARQETWVWSGLRRSPRGGHGNPLQYSCLENPHGQRSLAGHSPWGRKELDMTERLSTAQSCSLPSIPFYRSNFVLATLYFL